MKLKQRRFDRQEHIDRTDEHASPESPLDILIIGGGATGVGVAVDAASRGYSVALLEQSDFGKGTSSRSTKLVHGGVRYLKQGNISLVREALLERALLLRNAPHVVRDLPFVIPCPNQWQAFFYGTGLKMYDLLAGKNNLSGSKRLSRAQVIERIPTMEPKQSVAGILYHDGQFDDARLLVNLAQTASRHGACLINYAAVTSLIKSESGRVCGATWQDAQAGSEHRVYARVVINATGPFCDAVRRMDEPAAAPLVAASQGIHLVLPKKFLPGETAIMVPKTADGRVVFVIPWHDCVVLGTTDTPIARVSLDPAPLASEIEFLLETVSDYLVTPPTKGDILSVFTGIRPLVVANPGAKTSKLPRDHSITVSSNRMITITGGKWTTYRKMAEDCVDRACKVADLMARPCLTKALPIAGGPDEDNDEAFEQINDGKLHVYGSDAMAVQSLGKSLTPLSTGTETGQFDGNAPIDARLSITPAQIVWAVRKEMARTVDDVLARRTRSLFFDTRAAIEIAPIVAAWMARELETDSNWQSQQIADFQAIANTCMPPQKS